MNELSVTEEETIRSLLQLGWSRRRVARETGHHRATIERVARAMPIAAATEKPKPATDPEVATDLPGIGVEAAPELPGAGIEVATDLPGIGVKAATDLVSIGVEAATDLPASDPKVAADLPGIGVEAASDVEVKSTQTKRSAVSISRSRCEAHRSFIVAEIAKGRNAVAIYQDLVEHHGYDGAYNAVKRFVRKRLASEPKVSCRFETPPGADYVEFRVMLSRNRDRFCLVPSHVYTLSIIPPRSNVVAPLLQRRPPDDRGYLEDARPRLTRNTSRIPRCCLRRGLPQQAQVHRRIPTETASENH